jgi:hypothetical protein
MRIVLAATQGRMTWRKAVFFSRKRQLLAASANCGKRGPAMAHYRCNWAHDMLKISLRVDQPSIC